MSSFAAIAAVLSVGMITYASRAGLIVFLADRPLPTNITRVLRYVGPALVCGGVEFVCCQHLVGVCGEPVREGVWLSGWAGQGA